MANWSTTQWALLVALMAIGTLASRLLPLLVLGKKRLPVSLQRFLRFVPAAVLTAAIAPALLVRSGELSVSASNEYLLAAAPTFLVGFLSRNLLGAVVIGLLSISLFRQI